MRTLTTILAAALAVGIAFAHAAPARTQGYRSPQAWPGATPADAFDDSTLREASPEAIDGSIAWIDFLLDRTAKGDILIENSALMIREGDLDLIFPVNRDFLIRAMQLEVSEGRISARDGARKLIGIARKSGELRANLQEQRKRLVVRRQELRAVSGGTPGAFKVFSAVPVKPSATFSGNKVGALTVDTERFDRTPYRITGDFSGLVSLPQGGRVVLAGNAAGTGSWNIDNFVYIRIGDRSFVAGMTEAVADGGGTVQFLGPAGAPLDLSLYFRPGVATPVRIMALDYGGVGGVTEVWLVVTAR